MEVKIINRSITPYQSMLLVIALAPILEHFEKPIVLKPLQRALVPTGLFIELPVGFEAQIRPRSGLPLKKGITVLNTFYTIDSDYRGEIGVILINLKTQKM